MSRKNPKNQKGQYFIISALLLCLGFYIVTPLPKALVTTPSEDMGYISENIEKELSFALDYGINQSNPYNILINYSRFIQARMSERYINFSMLWIMAENTTGGSANITAGNFFEEQKTVAFRVSSDPNKNFSVASNTTNSTVLNSLSPVSFVQISFNDAEFNTSMVRDKTSLYGYVRLQRDQNSIIRQFFV